MSSWTLLTLKNKQPPSETQLHHSRSLKLLSGRAEDNTHLKEFLQTTIYSEGSNKPLDGSSHGEFVKKRIVGAKPATGSHKQNHIFRDVRGPRVSDNLNSPPHAWSVGKQNCSIGALFYGFAFLFLNFPYFSLENARNPSSRAQGALEEEENCHGRVKLLPKPPHLVK